MRIELHKICVPTDFSAEATIAQNYGATLADRFDAELHILHVVENPAEALPDQEVDSSAADRLEHVEQRVRRLLEHVMLPASERLQVVRVVRHGIPYHEICQYAREATVDLIVLGTHGRSGLKHLLIGSVAERVVRSSPCPVLTVRQSSHPFVVPD